MTPTKKRKWLAERRTGIGGSDSAAAVGRSRWMTRLMLYLDKTGEREVEETPAMHWGTIKEPLIRQEFANVTGRTVEVPGRIIRSERHPFMLVNLDGIADGRRVFEAKTARSDDGWGPGGSDEIPEEYIFQTQHAMTVTGLEVADVAVLIGSSDFRIYEIPADREFQELLIEAEAEFWSLVQKRIPPDPVDPADVRRRWRVSQAIQVTATEALRQIAHDLAYFKALKSQAEDWIDERSAQLQQFMGEAGELLDVGGEVLATWKTSKAGTKFDLDTFRAENPDLYAKYVRESETKRPFLLKLKASVPCPQLPPSPPAIESTATPAKTTIAPSPSAPSPSAVSPSSKGSRRKSKVA